MKNICLLVLLLSWMAKPLYAHGDLHKRIVKATKSINADPENEELYLHRGKLYYQHEEFNKGIADLHKAIEKGYEGEQVHLFLSKCYYAIADYSKAEDEIKQYFAISPDHVVAHNLYGKILYGQKRFSLSATEFEYVINHATEQLPENYINAATSWIGLNTEEGLDKGISILQKGISEQGHLISLQQHLIKVLLDVKRYDQAILIQESIIESQNRKETAFYTLYEIAIAKGDQCLALDALNNAEFAWQKLPKRIKSNSAMIQLHSDIETNLHQLTFTENK